MTRPNVPILLHPKRLRRRGPSGAPTILAMNSSHGSGSRVGHRAPTWSWTWKWKIHENTWNVLYKWNFPAIYKYKQTYIYIYAVYVCICIYIYIIYHIYIYIYIYIYNIGISGSSSGVHRTLGVTKAGSASSVPRHSAASAARRHGRVAPMGGEPPKVWGKRSLGWSQHRGGVRKTSKNEV